VLARDEVRDEGHGVAPLEEGLISKYLRIVGVNGSTKLIEIEDMVGKTGGKTYLGTRSGSTIL
jgi:hypothetical protein